MKQQWEASSATPSVYGLVPLKKYENERRLNKDKIEPQEGDFARVCADPVKYARSLWRSASMDYVAARSG